MNWISRLDGDDWTPILIGPYVIPLPYWSPGVSDLQAWQGRLYGDTPEGLVLAMCEHEGSLFVGGSFEHAGLRQSQNIARWAP